MRVSCQPCVQTARRESSGMMKVFEAPEHVLPLLEVTEILRIGVKTRALIEVVEDD